MRLNELLLRPFGGAREAVPARSPAVLARAERRRRSRRWGLLASADFRRLWVIGVVAFAVRWLEMLVVGVFVYQHTGSAFDVALMTMPRMLPMALFGAVIGAWVERIERRIALIAVVLIMLATAVWPAVLAYLGWPAVWHLALASFASDIAPPEAGGAVLSRMLVGLALVRRDPRVVGTLVITVIYNVFGWPFTSMIPVIGQDNLGLGASGIGILASMDGIGAFCGALLI